MKKFIAILSVLFLVGITESSAYVRTKIGKYPRDRVVIAEFYANPSDSISIDYVLADYRDMFRQAMKAKSCHTIYIFTAKDDFYKIIHKDTLDVEKYMASLEQEFEKESWTTTVKKVTGTRRERVSGPKYRSVTYHNGRVDSVYESDWSSGSFSSETSTYRTGSDTYRTVTSYVPEQYREVNTYESVKTTYTGIDVYGYILYRPHGRGINPVFK